LNQRDSDGSPLNRCSGASRGRQGKQQGFAEEVLVVGMNLAVGDVTLMAESWKSWNPPQNAC